MGGSADLATHVSDHLYICTLDLNCELASIRESNAEGGILIYGIDKQISTHTLLDFARRNYEVWT